MPLFGRKREPSPPPREPTPPPIEEPRRRAFFSGRRDPEPEYAQQQYAPQQHTQQRGYAQQQQPIDPEPHSSRRSHGLFSRRRSPSPGDGPVGRNSMTSHSSVSSAGYHDAPDRSSSKRGFLSKRGGGGGIGGHNDDDLDPSILHARDRLTAAEQAEEDARRALAAAKHSAASARDDIQQLELEAREDARRAKIKESQARDFSKRGKALGRTLH